MDKTLLFSVARLSRATRETFSLQREGPFSVRDAVNIFLALTTGGMVLERSLTPMAQAEKRKALLNSRVMVPFLESVHIPDS